MSIDRRLLVLGGLGALGAAAGAHAQTRTLQPPIAAASASASSPTLSDFANKSGGGYHSPLSAFQPLPDRADVVPWPTLVGINTRMENKRFVPVFTPAVLALSGKPQRVQGFMMPLQPGERISHFLLSQVPLTCGFCVPGGPESMIEVRAKTPVKYGFDAIVVEGRFAALTSDPYGIYYRVTDAVAVR
jgi:uncharacterized protein